jgi:hypothetical protein
MTPRQDGKAIPRFVPYTPAAIRPPPEKWQSLRLSISPKHLALSPQAFFEIHAELDFCVEPDLFDLSPTQLDYLVAQATDVDCHESLRSTAFARFISVALLSESVREYFDEGLIDALFKLVEEGGLDARLDSTPLHVLHCLCGNTRLRRCLLSDRFLTRASHWIDDDDPELKWAGLFLIRRLLAEERGDRLENDFPEVLLPKDVISGVLRCWSNPDLPYAVQFYAGRVIGLLWEQPRDRTRLLEAGVIEHGFEIIGQPTINQTAALNLLCRLLQDPAAQARISPRHYSSIQALTQPNQLWIQASAEKLKSTMEYHSLYRLLEEPIA